MLKRLSSGCALTVVLLINAGNLPAETEETLDKTFTISPGGTLVTDVDFGSIEVNTQPANEVTIHVWRKVSRRNKAEEEQFLRERPVIFSQNGNVVTIRSHRATQARQSYRGTQRTEGKYTITVPAKFNVQLKTAGGGIKVRQLVGEVITHTSGGGLIFSHVQGLLDGHTSGGGIQASECEGNLKVETSGGAIQVTGGKGRLEGKTSGGPVEVSEFHGPVRVESSGGDLSIKNVVGKVDGSTSGGAISASFSSPLSDAVHLETSGGGVTLRVPTESAFDLDASTSGGGVTSDLAVTGVDKAATNHLKGTVNGGGKSVVLRSSGGGIQVTTL